MGVAPDLRDIRASGQRPLQVSAFRAGVEHFERRKWGWKRTFTFTLRDASVGTFRPRRSSVGDQTRAQPIKVGAVRPP